MTDLERLEAYIAQLPLPERNGVRSTAQLIRNVLSALEPGVGEVAIALVALEIATKNEGESDARDGQ